MPNDGIDFEFIFCVPVPCFDVSPFLHSGPRRGVDPGIAVFHALQIPNR